MKLVTIIPCLNEEVTIRKVVEDCRQHLPQSKIYVFDNGSTDKTAECARAAGAEVIYSPLRGKGNVLRQAFRLLDADFYIMVDGDGTYPVDRAPDLVDRAYRYKYEMVTGARLEKAKAEAFRPLHFFGNHLFTGAIKFLFGHPVRDALTGMRVFSKRFVHEVTLLSRGFEVETELTIRAIVQDMAFLEVPVPYDERPQGSRSKLRTFRDGWAILRTIVGFVKDFRPLLFYSALGVIVSALTFCEGLWFVGEIPSSVIDACGVLAALFFALGFYFDSHFKMQRLRLNKSSFKITENPDAESSFKRAS